MLTGYIIEKYSRMTGAYTCNRLVEEACKRGVDLRIVGIADTVVDEKGNIYHSAPGTKSCTENVSTGQRGDVISGQLMEPCDFVINRYKYGHLKDAIGGLAKRTYNNTDAFNIYINKYMQVRNLQSEAFHMPKFLLATSMAAFSCIVDRLGVPFVAKGLESSQGAEVFLISNEEDYRELGRKFAADKEYLFEEYISISYGRDIRFYSIRGEVVACMTREAAQGFKANVALGAGVREYPIDDNIRQAARDIYEQTGLDFLGIDLLFGEDKPYFCEINVMPGIEGMERATGVNVAGAIIDTILGDFARQAVDYVYASYLKAEPYLKYDAPDSEKRNPALSRDIIQRLWKQWEIPAVLVTGSKGKGSVAKMIATVMGAHRKTGLMTSPHILRFNERFQIEGESVGDEAMEAAISSVKREFDGVERTLSEKEYISPMGIQAAAALTIFGSAAAEFQVMECGKGAAYDDVNNVPHKYAVINRIFLEHTRELGGTLAKIAENKAAIMTRNMDAERRMAVTDEQSEAKQVAFTSEQVPEVMKVLEHRAREAGWELRVYGRDFQCENITYTVKGMHFDVVTKRQRYEGLQIPLLGTHQAKNCAMAIALCEEELGGLNIPAVREALKWLEWPGRLEILSSNPLMLLDACINRGSCGNVLEALEQLGIKKVTTIIGIPSDKDYLGVAQAMQQVSGHMILTKSTNAHYQFGPKQVQTLSEAGIKAQWTSGIGEALKLARLGDGDPESREELPIVILGTTSLISDVKELAGTPMPL